jgi:hypothetical protein
MARKLKLAVFDADMRATVKKYPISESGNQILVKSGGKEHFMPSFDNTSYLEFPRKFLFFVIGWEKVYFARKLSKKCINFKTGELEGPSPEFVEEMGAKVMLDRLNKQKQETVWQIWLILLVSIFTLLNVLGIV